MLLKYLNITNVKQRFLQDKVALLKDIVRAYLVRYPFQNITSFGQFQPLERKPPGRREMMQAVFGRGGGLCGHHNVPFQLQLESIGYESRRISGCFRRTGVPDSHFITLVRIPPSNSKDISGDKLYFVDVGCGIPLHEPILLNELPYRATAGGFAYRYEWVNKNSIQRVNENGDALVGQKPSNFLSPQDYTINLNTVEWETLADAVVKIYTNPRSVFLHQGVYCSRYLSIADDDFEFVCIRGTELINVTKHTRKTKMFKDYFELQPVILEYFPMIDPVEVEKTVRIFSQPWPFADNKAQKSTS